MTIAPVVPADILDLSLAKMPTLALKSHQKGSTLPIFPLPLLADSPDWGALHRLCPSTDNALSKTQKAMAIASAW